MRRAPWGGAVARLSEDENVSRGNQNIRPALAAGRLTGRSRTGARRAPVRSLAAYGPSQ